MLEVAGKPIIGHIVERVIKAGPEEVCVVVGYKADKVRSYLTASFDCRFSFVEQDDPKGLGDAVYRARERCEGSPVLVMLGDTIVDMDVSRMVGGGDVIGVREVDDPKRFGVAELDGEFVSRLVEKPDKPVSNLALVGVYHIEDSELLFRSLERLVSEDRRTRGEYQLTDALQLMVEGGTRLRTVTVQHWLDCGTPDALLDTNRHMLAHSGYSRAREGTVLVPPVYVHDSAEVVNSVVGPHVSVGENAKISCSVISDSIVNRDACVDHALLRRSILGEGCVVEEGPRSLNVGDLSEFRTD
jgi:glucose-1-phosphate thymidylyltransferase